MRSRFNGGFPISHAPHIGLDMDIGTWLHTLLRGRLVGKDAAGNRYYQARRGRDGRARRWVVFKGAKEASAVTAEWHGWLHHMIDEPLPETGRKPWQKPHLPNMTGTPDAYLPAGHEYRGGHRPPATGDYEAWTPDRP